MKFKDVLEDYNKLKNKSERLSSLLVSARSEETMLRIAEEMKEIQAYVSKIENIEVNHKRIVG